MIGRFNDGLAEPADVDEPLDLLEMRDPRNSTQLPLLAFFSGSQRKEPRPKGLSECEPEQHFTRLPTHRAEMRGNTGADSIYSRAWNTMTA